MFVSFHRKTGKISCAMIARDLAEAFGYRHFGIDCEVAWFPHAELSSGIDNLRVAQDGGQPIIIIG
jgi:hypothetical protein